MTHAEFRQVIREAFRRVFGREPTRPEAQFAHAVAELETSCGKGWRREGAVGSNNMGAIQAGSSWTGATFVHKDSTPQPDGTNKWYETKFRKYPTPLDGCIDLIKVLYTKKIRRGKDVLDRQVHVLAPAAKGDSLGVSAGLQATVYYEGFGPTPQARLANHHKALTDALTRIAMALNEPMPDGSGPPERTLKQGMEGEDVARLQLLLDLTPDGKFGPKTKAALQAEQRLAGLIPDGVYGPTSRKVIR